LKDRVNALGFHLTDEQVDTVFLEIKKLADKKKDIYDGDVVALVEHELHGSREDDWKLVAFEASSGSGHSPRAKLTLKRGDEEFTEELAIGDGPIDAAFSVIEKITGRTLICKDFEARSATIGRDAQGEAIVDIEHEDIMYRGRGVSTDTVEATIKATLNAVNQIPDS